MPIYMIERTFAEELDLTNDDVRLIDEINADEGVRWLFSFLSADRRRTYCLYEAPTPDAIVSAARRAASSACRRGRRRPLLVHGRHDGGRACEAGSARSAPATARAAPAP